MPSTYTGSGIELIADGEQSGTWGQTTNTNLQIINRMTSEFGVIALSGTTHTLTISDGTLSDGQYGVLIFNGSPSGTNTVTISPNDAKRIFLVENTSGQTVVLTQGSGGNVSILDGDGAIVYCNGDGASAEVFDIGSTLRTTNNLIASNNLSDLASTSVARGNLGVAIGSDVQAWDANLDQIAALAVTDGNFIVGNGSAWVAESGNTALASLGVNATAAELNTLDGITATTAELNILDGATVTAAELNVLDGITATTAELNFTDGVTSNIQTQLNAKASNSAASIATSISLTGAAQTWQFALSGNDLIIKYGATSLAKLDTSGNFTVIGDVTAFGTV